MTFNWEKHKYTYMICLFLTIIIIYTLTMVFIYKSEKNEQVLKGQKTLGHYKILKRSGPAPLHVDLLEIETNQTIKNLFVSAKCPDYRNINIGKTYALFRYNNLQVKTGISTYSYEGLYDVLCAKVKKEIQESK